MIAEDALETALRALHAAFELERPESVAVEAARDAAPDPGASAADLAAAGGSSAQR
jgi:hypothetical protein